MTELPKNVSDAIMNAAKDEHCWPFIRGGEFLWQYLTAQAGEFDLDEAYLRCKSYQGIHGDPPFVKGCISQFKKDAARIAAAEITRSLYDKAVKGMHDYGLQVDSLERENAALREAVLGSDWNIPRADLLKPADRIRAARKSPNSGETLPRVGECTCATTKTTCPTHLTPYPEER